MYLWGFFTVPKVLTGYLPKEKRPKDFKGKEANEIIAFIPLYPGGETNPEGMGRTPSGSLRAPYIIVWSKEKATGLWGTPSIFPGKLMLHR